MKPTKVQLGARVAVATLLHVNREVALSMLVVFAHVTAWPRDSWMTAPDENGWVVALADRPTDVPTKKVAVLICPKKGRDQHLQIDPDTLAFDGETMSIVRRKEAA